ncbi:enoyl-CoA delta isomerase 2, peroxisomal-like [Ananas comosus]|uniref:Enoyl-CoA delta isomerase 2, peroxisomal-like n=1 Tax=Ananas comosus TaxID=4615 RepID=A0A6P5EE07_ANACO|nr:enoyl-CoA delta isomerase 2, peroxisomal-like [Ananas comosus]
MTSSESVTYGKIHKNVGSLTLTGPEGKHCLDLDLIKEFSSRLDDAEKDKNIIIGLITSHEGSWFSGGLHYPSSETEQKKVVREFEKLIEKLVKLPFPTVARVKGCAYGAGLTLALAHDYLVLSNDTPVSLRQDELAQDHELPHYAAALLTDKFPPSVAWDLAALSPYVKPPHYAPMSDYVKRYVGWSEDQVVDELLRPSASRIRKDNGNGNINSGNYSKLRERLLAHVSGVLKSSATSESSTKQSKTSESDAAGSNTPPT